MWISTDYLQTHLKLYSALMTYKQNADVQNDTLLSCCCASFIHITVISHTYKGFKQMLTEMVFLCWWQGKNQDIVLMDLLHFS